MTTMSEQSIRNGALLKSGTLSPNPWDLTLSGQNVWRYTGATRTEVRAPQGCAPSAASSAGMARAAARLRPPQNTQIPTRPRLTYCGPKLVLTKGSTLAGGNNIGGSTTRQSFNGLIDEAKQYYRVLSDAEIQAIYASSAPISYWQADSSAVDVVGGNNGTFTNGSYAAGVKGQAFNFNGSTSNVHVSGSSTVSGARSFAAWVYPHAVSGLAQPIWTAGTAGAGDFFNIVMTPTGCAGAYKLSFDHWGVACIASTVAVTPEAWNHVAMTFDGSVIRFYVNGVPAGSGARAMFSYSIGTMDIGGNNIGGSTTRQSFNGLIDEAKQYNRALSDAEVQALYAAP